MKKDKNIYVTNEHILNEELSELDLELYDSFNFDYDHQEFIEIEKRKTNDWWYINNSSLDIEKLSKLIKKFKKKGVTHIQMEHHGDHHGYIFTGVKIELSTESEILEYNLKLLKYKNKESEIKKLYQEIEKIKKS